MILGNWKTGHTTWQYWLYVNSVLFLIVNLCYVHFGALLLGSSLSDGHHIFACIPKCPRRGANRPTSWRSNILLYLKSQKLMILCLRIDVSLSTNWFVRPHFLAERLVQSSTTIWRWPKCVQCGFSWFWHCSWGKKGNDVPPCYWNILENLSTSLIALSL